MAVIIFGAVQLHAAELVAFPNRFAHEDECNEWGRETINDYIVINSTKDDPAHMVLAASFCIVDPERPT